MDPRNDLPQQRRQGTSGPLKLAGALVGMALTGAVVAQGVPADYGSRFAALCAGCHGTDGRSQMPGTPSLAGQHSHYAQ